MSGRGRTLAFGLIEVLLALALLALALLGQLALQSATLRAEASARALAQATEHARSELALARALPAATTCSMPLPVGVSACGLLRTPCEARACLDGGGMETLTVETESVAGQRVRLVTLQRRPPTHRSPAQGP